MESSPGPVLEFLGHVAYHFEQMRPLLPTYLHLLISAIFPIVTAAHASLSRPPSARKALKTVKSGEEVDDIEEVSSRIESLSPSDAILFPVLAGGTLVSLYFILKWLQDPAWLNWCLGIYFSQMGLFFATKFLKDIFTIVRSFALPNQYSRAGEVWRVEGSCYQTDSGKTTTSPLPSLLGGLPLPQKLSSGIWATRSFLYTKAQLHLHVWRLITLKRPLELFDILSLAISTALVGWHAFISKPWYLTNFMGFSFCYGSLQFMTPTTGWTGTLLLGALFLYDIYFVFFTPMMVTVATKLDVPIKLLFPKPDGCTFPMGAPEGSPALEEYAKCLAKKRTMAMLGLGDIVVPGMILAFALRFDLYLHYLRQGKTANEDDKPAYLNAKGSWGERFWTSWKLWTKDLRAKSFEKTYFYATIAGYLAGMIVTVVVMQVAQHAQPALLYLVPGVLGSFWGTALIKGDLKTLWNYSEQPEIKDDDKKTIEDKDKKPHSEMGKAPEGKEPADEAAKDENNDAIKRTIGKQDRQLFHFSITLPQNVNKEPIDSHKSTDEAKSLLSNHDDTSAALKGRESVEPPNKRVRRS
jgi:minor histocompatibility antigen H13